MNISVNYNQEVKDKPKTLPGLYWWTTTVPGDSMIVLFLTTNLGIVIKRGGSGYKVGEVFGNQIGDANHTNQNWQMCPEDICVSFQNNRGA